VTGPPDGTSSRVPTWLAERLRCPDCHASQLHEMSGKMVCSRCNAEFPVTRGVAALVRTDNELFPPSSYFNAPVSSAPSALETLKRAGPSRSVNMSYRRKLRAFAAALYEAGASSVLVIGAGSQKAWLDKFFAQYPTIQIVYTDVDIRGQVDLFCDAHELPFLDETFDGVVASAVLEHVLYPERVVAEIHRVLAGRGLVYTEIPFLQQVHEGAYDFTRYTLSGHRRLFNHFEEVSSGVVAGPGTTLAWALEHFAICWTPRLMRTAMRLAVRTAFFWLKYSDYLLGQAPAAADGACCTFFVGRKGTARRTDRDIIEHYAGVKTIRHV